MAGIMDGKDLKLRKGFKLHAVSSFTLCPGSRYESGAKRERAMRNAGMR